VWCIASSVACADLWCGCATCGVVVRCVVWLCDVWCSCVMRGDGVWYVLYPMSWVLVILKEGYCSSSIERKREREREAEEIENVLF